MRGWVGFLILSENSLNESWMFGMSVCGGRRHTTSRVEVVACEDCCIWMESDHSGSHVRYLTDVGLAQESRQISAASCQDTSKYSVLPSNARLGL